MTWARGIKTGSATVKAVLMAIANYADERGVCWPSQEQLADDTELSRHSVMRAIDALESAGYLVRERRHRKDGSRSSDLISIDLSSTQQRSRDQCSSEQRSTQHKPKSHGATAEENPSLEPSLNRSTRARASIASDEKAAVEAWNSLASEINLPSVQKMTASRKQKLAARLKDCGGLAGWDAALAKIRGSPFCRGDPGPWKADFDFVLQESSFVKLMEGKYDGTGKRAEAPQQHSSRARNREILDAIVAEAERRENAGCG